MNPKTKEPENVRGLDGYSYTVKSRRIRGKGKQLEEFDLSSIKNDEDGSGQLLNTEASIIGRFAFWNSISQIFAAMIGGFIFIIALQLQEPIKTLFVSWGIIDPLSLALFSIIFFFIVILAISVSLIFIGRRLNRIRAEAKELKIELGDRMNENKLQTISLILAGAGIAGVLMIYGFFPTVYSAVILNPYSAFTIGIILFITLVAILQRARGLEKGRFRFELLLILAGIISILIGTSVIPAPSGLDSMTFCWFYLLTFACALLVAIGFYLAIPAKDPRASLEK